MQIIDQLQQLKVLGDSQRLAILRRLMDHPATLSQLGEHFGASPAHVRHHVKALEEVGLVKLTSTRLVRGFQEKYYQATQRAYLVQMAVLPETSESQGTLVIGSNDPVLQHVFDDEQSFADHPDCVFLSFDSLEGLVMLQEGICDMATIHLVDPQTGEYNQSYVRHLFPGEDMALVHLYQREEGFLVQPGNPRQIRGLDDLIRPDIRLINRERGAGTRVWLDHALKTHGLPPGRIAGYADEARSHEEVAQSIADGKANVGLGLPTSAQLHGLDFIPLFEEPYDLVLSRKAYTDPRFNRFFERLSVGLFEKAVRNFAGYRQPQNQGQVAFIS